MTHPVHHEFTLPEDVVELELDPHWARHMFSHPHGQRLATLQALQQNIILRLPANSSMMGHQRLGLHSHVCADANQPTAARSPSLSRFQPLIYASARHLGHAPVLPGDLSARVRDDECGKFAEKDTFALVIQPGGVTAAPGLPRSKHGEERGRLVFFFLPPSNYYYLRCVVHVGSLLPLCTLTPLRSCPPGGETPQQQALAGGRHSDVQHPPGHEGHPQR